MNVIKKAYGNIRKVGKYRLALRLLVVGFFAAIFLVPGSPIGPHDASATVSGTTLPVPELPIALVPVLIATTTGFFLKIRKVFAL